MNREVGLPEDLLAIANGSWANCRQSDAIAQLFQCHESFTLAVCFATKRCKNFGPSFLWACTFFRTYQFLSITKKMR